MALEALRVVSNGFNSVFNSDMYGFDDVGDLVQSVDAVATRALAPGGSQSRLGAVLNLQASRLSVASFFLNLTDIVSGRLFQAWDNGIHACGNFKQMCLVGFNAAATLDVMRTTHMSDWISTQLKKSQLLQRMGQVPFITHAGEFLTTYAPSLNTMIFGSLGLFQIFAIAETCQELKRLNMSDAKRIDKCMLVASAALKTMRCALMVLLCVAPTVACGAQIAIAANIFLAAGAAISIARTVYQGHCRYKEQENPGPRPFGEPIEDPELGVVVRDVLVSENVGSGPLIGFVGQLCEGALHPKIGNVAKDSQLGEILTTIKKDGAEIGRLPAAGLPGISIQQDFISKKAVTLWSRLIHGDVKAILPCTSKAFKLVSRVSSTADYVFKVIKFTKWQDAGVGTGLGTLSIVVKQLGLVSAAFSALDRLQTVCLWRPDNNRTSWDAKAAKANLVENLFGFFGDVTKTTMGVLGNDPQWSWINKGNAIIDMKGVAPLVVKASEKAFNCVKESSAAWSRACRARAAEGRRPVAPDPALVAAEAAAAAA
jgi:hypothetical protein